MRVTVGAHSFLITTEEPDHGIISRCCGKLNPEFIKAIEQENLDFIYLPRYDPNAQERCVYVTVEQNTKVIKDYWFCHVFNLLREYRNFLEVH